MRAPLPIACLLALGCAAPSEPFVARALEQRLDAAERSAGAWRLDEAAGAAAEVLRAARARGLATVEARAHLLSARIAERRGERASAGEAVRSAWRIAARSRSDPALLLEILSEGARLGWRPSDAPDPLDLAERLEGRRPLALAHLVLARWTALEGDPEGAADHASRAAQLLRVLEDLGGRGGRVLAEAVLLEQRMAASAASPRVTADLSEAARAAREAGDRALEAACFAALARAFARAGREADAQAWWRLARKSLPHPDAASWVGLEDPPAGPSPGSRGGGADSSAGGPRAEESGDIDASTGSERSAGRGGAAQ